MLEIFFKLQFKQVLYITLKTLSNSTHLNIFSEYFMQKKLFKGTFPSHHLIPQFNTRHLLPRRRSLLLFSVARKGNWSTGLWETHKDIFIENFLPFL
jgi:hypothetical protein